MLFNFVTSLCLVAVQATATVVPRQTSPQDLRAISFNIRYAAPGGTYERPWSTRGPLVISQLKQSTTSASESGSVPIIGLQEVLHQQLLDIKKGLGSNWAHLGTGRDDGKQSGEYVPILYKTDTLKVLASTQKWLSLTPDKPSFWSGAGSRRYVVAAVFEVIGTGKRFIAANTHLDNVSQEARVEGAKIALQTIRTLQSQWGNSLGVYLTGDFNSDPGSGDAYGTIDKDGYLDDLYNLATAGQRAGPYGTFSGFDPKAEPNNRIDFIWLGPNATTTWKVRKYEVLSNVVGSVYMSDHRPVVGDITLR
jgi:endonuclease/exonuclease/phosphatase family metal-dependent hydrolase